MRNSDWFYDAACLESYDHRFFGSMADQAEVRALYCVDCPVKADCLVMATAAGEARGLWGGKRNRTKGNGR